MNARPLLEGCFAPHEEPSDNPDIPDDLLWSMDTAHHAYGDFSSAVVQANFNIEDKSQLETRDGLTFIGVYDGHGGDQCARFIVQRIYQNFMKWYERWEYVNEDVIRHLFIEIDDMFLNLVKREQEVDNNLVIVGSCCLVGIIWEGVLFVANAGDSRAVLGHSRLFKKIIPVRLSSEHNVNLLHIRQGLKLEFPDDTQLLVERDGVWRLRDLIQVSKAIGDAYMKIPHISVDKVDKKFHRRGKLERPIMSSEPGVHRRVIQDRDEFVIFASDGLWELLTDEEAVEFVQSHRSKRGVAKLLLRKALVVASRRMRRSYNQIKLIPRGNRRVFHDDITVFVVFLKSSMVSRMGRPAHRLSMTGGFPDQSGPSNQGGPSTSGTAPTNQAAAGPSNQGGPSTSGTAPTTIGSTSEKGKEKEEEEEATTTQIADDDKGKGKATTQIAEDT